jgi:beta-lactamase class A
MNSSRKKIKLAGIFIIFSFFGMVLAIKFSARGDTEASCKQHYEFLSSRVGCDASLSRVDQRAMADFELKLKDVISQKKSTNEIKDAAVYVRTLQDGPILNVNAAVTFNPASLLKLPLYMTYMRLAEEEVPSLLDQRIEVGQFTDVPQVFSSEQIIQTNQAYSIQELLDRMIIYSDNRAYNVLQNYLVTVYVNTSPFLETLYGLGIVPEEVGSDVEISIRSYASIFRQLFYATYLSKEMSERTLKVLGKSTFQGGLRGGVPLEIPLAHKFGERVLADTDNRQLHDCGIVYMPERPYIICVMTRGTDFQILDSFITDISRMVFQEFEKRSSKPNHE